MIAELLLCLSLGLWSSSCAAGFEARADGATSGAGADATETIRGVDGARIEGRLEGGGPLGFRFVPAGGGDPLTIASPMVVEFTPPAQRGAAPDLPFHVRIGAVDRVSGRLVRIDEATVELFPGDSGAPLRIARSAVLAVAQSPGEVLVFRDGFERLDPSRWERNGQPTTAEPTARREGKAALRLPSGGSSVQHLLEEPLPAGRVELDFHDEGKVVPERRYAIELEFRSPTGSEVVQVVPGWDSEVLAVRTRGGGPPLAVQQLERVVGWNQLRVEFSTGRTAISVNGQELAYGDGPGGPLVRLRIGTEPAGGEDKAAPAALLDDLGLVRNASPLLPSERDVAQDEVRLTTGDQLFGEVESADEVGARFLIAGRELRLPWREVEGLYLRRAPVPSKRLDGLWVRARWTAGGRDADQAEGVLTLVEPESLTIETPYAGRVRVPRLQALELEVLGRGDRLVLDPTPHHLGHSVAPALDPPQPEGGQLEVAFERAALGFEPQTLTIDVVQAIGIEGDLVYSEAVRRGELVTHVSLNGERFDTINRHITRLNDTVQRIRVPLPAGRIQPGRNTIRLDQVGARDDPRKLDNLGVLCLGLERFEGTTGPAEPRR